MGDAAAKTEFAKGVVTITAKRGVRDRAQAGSGRDRMTLAHELGHAVFHHGTPLFRLLNATGSTKLAEEKAYESAEHQAKIFAAAFLIHDDDAAKMRGAEEISVEFLVSLEAARICFERLAKKLERSKSAERVRKLADETRAILSGNSTPKKVVYLDSLCGTCHQQTLLPIANKVLCDTCGFIGDGFQDGDPL
ncbi:ImmA/IrrE family metallo-endopeptidase [Pseudorhodoplanes sp.]|uniref:ImmA/IrrE family metallo-endopeptidase n=1 Tax=Pseudorhodoplanes sp. TaxID=1934341 RepID=UPI003D0C11FB